MVVPRDISEQRLDYVHWDMDGNQMFRYPMDIQEMGCATWVAATYLHSVQLLYFRLIRGDVQLNVKFGMPEFRNVPLVSTGFPAKLWQTGIKDCSVASFFSVDELYLRPSNMSTR